MNAIELLPAAGSAVVVVLLVVPCAWTAPLADAVCSMHSKSFLRSIPMRQRYIAIVDLSSSSQKSRFRTHEWPTPLPPPASPARAASAASSPARACAGRARAPPTRCAPTRRADAATGERAAATARELVKQLGQMRGAAMKIGQVLSTVDFTAIPESEREEFKAHARARCATTSRRCPFKRVEKLLEEELGEPLDDVFADFEEEAFAAASIGQVHRATTTRRPARSRSRSSTRASPRRSRPTCATCRCCSRWSSASRPASTSRRSRRSCASASATSSTTRSRPRTTARWRAPGATTRSSSSRRSTPSCSRRRVLVTELLDGRRFEEVKQLDERRARPLRRDRLPLLLRHAQAHCAAPPATRIPATTCCSTTAASASSTSGSCASSTPTTSRASARSPRRSTARRRAEVHARSDRARLPARARHLRARAPARPDPRPPASGTSSPASAASRPAYVADLLDRERLARARRTSTRCAARRSRRRRC